MNKKINKDEILSLAVEVEGHPDNVCPAIFGGLISTIMTNDKKPLYNCVNVKDGIKFVALIPRFKLSTEKARAILPKEILFKDCVYNIGRAALLVSAFSNGNYNLLREATKDKLHQQYRSGLIKNFNNVYNKALEYAELKENDTVFDIYCGIGSISLFLAQKATKVYGIEIVEDAIKDAKINAKLNNLNNVEFYVGKAEEVVPKMYSEGKTANVVVVDPPRKGCDEKVLDTIVSMKPDRVVYVSCNPSTLARDLAYLNERGYKCHEIQPVDMFPHSVHVENVAWLSRV